MGNKPTCRVDGYLHVACGQIADARTLREAEFIKKPWIPRRLASREGSRGVTIRPGTYPLVAPG